MLAVGDTAPPIDAKTSQGTRFVLSDQDALCTVIYFFPKAFTPGCTKETGYFRESYAEIALAGATIVGISTDDERTQCDFADSLRAPFPLIPDKDQAISRAYDVLWPIIGLARRITYVVGRARIIEAVFHHELAIREHRDDVLRFVNDKFRATRAH